MWTLRYLGRLALLGCLTTSALAETPEPASEKDYLDDVPIVLSVSRLPQRLSEVPGAVTVIDRQMIRMSGARDVADLLRFVPGFRVSNSFESNTPQGSYHSNLSDFSNHMQVMVDGRSVYSSYLQGSTGPGLQTVALEDIERIEVYRGSNSAAYGARAFLGSINIVTRDLADTEGVYAHLAGGDNSIADGMVRYGWGDDRARYRLSVDTRSDRGLSGSSSGDSVQRANFRSDMRLSNRDVLEFRAGGLAIGAGVGFANEDGNAPRTRLLDTSYLQLDWKRSLGADEDFSAQLSHTNESIRDRFSYAPIPGLSIDFGGEGASDNLTLQYTRRLGPTLRTVWGSELRQERVMTRALFNTDKVYLEDFTRVFGNLEWRPLDDVLLNVGGLYEYSSLAGVNVAPRAMVNWEVADGHTLRYGVSQAFRPPSIMERYGNVRYYVGGVLADSTYVARGVVGSEKVLARELGYLAELPGKAVTLDVRIFEEQIQGAINTENYALPGSGNDNMAIDFVNNEDYHVRGHEFQVKFKPWTDGQVIYGQSLIDSSQSVGQGAMRAVGGQFGMLMQSLPAGYKVSVSYYDIQANHFPSEDADSPAMYRTDLRLAREMRWDGHMVELSLVIQSFGGSYQDFLPSLRFNQQAYVMLRLEH
jgi:iron complex outermembrane receptor protein